MKKTIQIIGSGFSSLSAACYLAQAGHQVSLYEKNSSVGGRARQLKKDGFVIRDERASQNKNARRVNYFMEKYQKLDN